MTLCSNLILVLESRSKVVINAFHWFHCSCIATVADRFPATRVSTLSFRMIAAPILIGRKQGTTTFTFPVLFLTARGVRVLNTSPFYRLVAWHNRLCSLRTSLIFSRVITLLIKAAQNLQPLGDRIPLLSLEPPKNIREPSLLPPDSCSRLCIESRRVITLLIEAAHNLDQEIAFCSSL